MRNEIGVLRQDVVGRSGCFIDDRFRMRKCVSLGPLGEGIGTTVSNQHIDATSETSGLILVRGFLAEHFNDADRGTTGKGFVDHRYAILCDPYFSSAGKMVFYPGWAGLVECFDSDIRTGGRDVVDKVCRGTARRGEDNGAAALGGNRRQLSENMFRFPLVLLVRATNQHKRFLLLDFRMRLDVVDRTVGQEDIAAGYTIVGDIMARNDTQIEAADRQAGTHANHAQTAQVASQAQRRKVGTMTGAENQVRTW